MVTVVVKFLLPPALALALQEEQLARLLVHEPLHYATCHAPGAQECNRHTLLVDAAAREHEHAQAHAHAQAQARAWAHVRDIFVHSK
jgi:hypothetical protein